jgi:PAS domain S-box-containing protein
MGARRATRGRRVTRDHASATEEALAESNERYRSLFAYNPHAAFSLDADGTFTDANDVAQQLSGYSLEDFQQLDFTQILVPEHVPAAIDAFAGALNREPQQLTADMRHKDGHLLELSIAAVPVIVHGEVVGVHGVAEDVTENNEMRRELERTRRAAEEANAAKSLFLANMSHEVRTPLTSVLGATEMLGEDDLDPHQRYLVDVIHRSGERLLRLVNDILDVSRLEAGKLDVEESPFDVPTMIREVAGWAAPLAEREGLTLAYTVDPAVPDQLVGDAMRVSQVLTNLLGNAFKFTETGVVRMTVEAGATTRGVSEVRFVVEDSGIGIRHDQLTGLFDSFTQVDTSTTRKYGGAGLGLAICQELVTLMGGTLEARSTPGRGSTFSFTLPLRVVQHPSQ